MTKINAILAIGNETLVTKSRGSRKSLYQESLFEGLEIKERKSLRVKLRRKFTQFLNSYEAVKSDTKGLESLKAAWGEYAAQVYQDTTDVIEANAGEERLALATEFIGVMGNIPTTGYRKEGKGTKVKKDKTQE